MIILIPVLVAIYLVGLTGYFKLLSRIQDENPHKHNNKIAIGVLAVLWPIVLFYTLVRECYA